MQLAAVLQPLWPFQTTPSASWPRLVGRFLQILHSTGLKKKLPACCSGKAWILVQRVTSLDSAGTMHCIQTCTPTYMYPANKDRTFILKVYERRWAVHSLRCNGKAIFQIHRGFKGDMIVCLFLFSLVKCARMPVDTGKTPRLGVNSGVVFLLICSTYLQMNLSRYQSSAFNGSWVYPGK